MADDQLPQINVGSYDWAGYKAAAGGTHTGTAIITMNDGATFAVASSRAEVLQKLDMHAIAPGSPSLTVWVAFDQPSSVTPLILNPLNIASVA